MQLNDSSLLRRQAFVDGSWIDADDGATFTVTNPATGDVIADVAKCGADETRRAIEAAEKAQIDWRQKTASERSRLLRRWFDLMMEHQEDLAQIMTAEQGKPLAESRGEIAYGASFIEWFAEEAKRVYGDVIPPPATDRRIVVIKQPVGRGGVHHAVELSQRHARAQGRCRAGGGVYDGVQTGNLDPVVSLCDGRVGRPCRHPRWRDQRNCRTHRRHRRRADLEPDRPQAHLHRFDRSRQETGGRLRADHETHLDGARRQRALHRLRRRRPRDGGRRRRSPASTATPARPASAPTASWCRRA